MASDITLGGMSIDVGADEASFTAAQNAMGKTVHDAIVSGMRDAVGALHDAFDDIGPGEGGGGSGIGAGAAVGAGAAGANAGLARFGARAGGAAVARGAGAGGSAVLAGGAAAAAAFPPLIPVIIGLAIVGVALFALHKAISKAISALTSEANRLAGLNAALAVAKIERTVGDLNRSLARANAIGPIMLDVSRLFERIKDRLQPIADILLVGLAVQLKIFLEVLDNVVKALVALFDFTLKITADILRAAADVIRFLRFLSFAFGKINDMIAVGFERTADAIDAVRDQLKADAEALDRQIGVNKIFAEQLASLSNRGLEDLFPNVFPPHVYQPAIDPFGP